MEDAHAEPGGVGLDEELRLLTGHIAAFRERRVDAEHAQDGVWEPSLGGRVPPIQGCSAPAVGGTQT